MSSTNFVFTLFEPLVPPPYPLSEKFTYLSYQWEIAPTTGKAHLQGFLQSKNKIRPSSVVKELFLLSGRHPHVEIARGSPEQARDYSRKLETRMAETTPFEIGSFRSGQGARTDLLGVAQLCEQRTPLPTIAKRHPTTWIKFHRGIESLSTMLVASEAKPRSTFGMVYIWGPSGCGKTYAVRTRWPDAYWLTETPKGWMDTYVGQDTIVIDDFSGVLPLQWMLRLCQPYPFEAERKGQSPVPVTAVRVILTSNFPPESIYEADKNCAAFMSRLTAARNGFVLNVMSGYEIEWPESFVKL